MSWSKNNAANRYLWIFVRSLHWDFANTGAKMTSFVDGGEWETRFIISAAVGDSQEMLKSKAKIFATKFNKWIIIQKDAQFESGYNTASAIEKLNESFALPSKLKDCADIVDDIYLCKGEVE